MSTNKLAAIAFVPRASAGVGKIMADRGAMLRNGAESKVTKTMADEWVSNFLKNKKVIPPGLQGANQRKVLAYEMTGADVKGSKWVP